MAEAFGFEHQSVGRGKSRQVLITRLSPTEFAARQAPAGPSLPPLDPAFDKEELEIYHTLKTFMLSKDEQYQFPTDKSNHYRKKVHLMAQAFDLDSESKGPRGTNRRYVLVKKVDAAVLAARREADAKLARAIDAYRAGLQEQAAHQVPQCDSDDDEASDGSGDDDDDDNNPHGTPLPVTPPRPDSAAFRFVSWNIEWFDYFFKSDTEFHQSNASADIDDVAALCSNIAMAIRVLAPDVIAVLEGPSSAARMNLFQKTFLNDEFDVISNDESGDQLIYFLVRKNGAIVDAALHVRSDEFLKEEWHIDQRGDMNVSEYNFTRRPLVVKAHARMQEGKRPEAIYFIAMHTKSKFIGGGKRLWKSSKPEKRAEFLRKAIRNRRRIAAECCRTRQCIDKVIYREHHQPLVVLCGDLNDGAGSDMVETLFLLFNSVDLVLGSPFYNSKLLNALLIRKTYVPRAWMWSCIFDDYVDDIPGKKVLIDHICVSNALKDRVLNAGIAHDIFLDACQQGANLVHASRQQRPSDHRPVYTDFKLLPKQ
eukprot:CAMPEP_0168581918 /NCGR_PEP_ID=MMETSP0420-20121227/1686_1 /TAXON_ID=498008 /ORGANISM="Pessonella sp." /LENGTH=536 /DNA_ID=CAMNT_0008616333 /DNA_START=498 /DNA_END=2108 /DNA_ORIENTATION=-